MAKAQTKKKNITKLISWNVNGIRAVQRKGALAEVLQLAPDILCLQETKAWAEQVELDLPDYHAVWCEAEKKGYSGTLTLSKIAPLSVTLGIGKKAHDKEGRVITTEFKDYYLVNCYTPNAQRGLTRLDYRQTWDKAFLAYCKKLNQKKPLVFCGDFNVAHTEIDLHNPKSNKNTHGFTPEERAGFDKIIAAGFLDTFREFEKSGGHYTWWSNMNNARARDIGWRIDYFCISRVLRKKLKTASIHKSITGSDHCPIEIELA